MKHLCMSLSDWSDLTTLITPFILLVWFYYSQIHLLSSNYYSKIVGTYSGFCEPVVAQITPIGHPYAGVIMDITQVDTNGYFMGQIIYGEVESGSSKVAGKVAGIFQFYGRIPYKFYFKKNRNPFQREQNSLYNGKVYIVDRFDFATEQKIEDFKTLEYDVIYYRERNSLLFNNQKILRENHNPVLPKTFLIDKKINVYFDVSKGVFMTVFNPNPLFPKSIREKQI